MTKHVVAQTSRPCTRALWGHTNHHFNSPNKSFCDQNGREAVIHNCMQRKRGSHDGYISPSPVTPEYSLLWSSVSKAPKSIVAVWQNRAVTVCLQEEKTPSVCLSFFMSSVFLSFMLYSLNSSVFLFLFFLPPFLPSLFLCSFLSHFSLPLLHSSLSVCPSLSYLFFLPSFLWLVFSSLLFSPSIPPSIYPVSHDTALCSAHSLLHVASSSCVAPVWTALSPSDPC